MFRQTDYEILVPSNSTQSLEVLNDLSIQDTLDEKKVQLCIHYKSNETEYLIDINDSLEKTPTQDLTLPIIIWNARTGEFRRIYQSQKTADPTKHITTSTNQVFGTSWSNNLIPDEFKSLEDLWVVCPSGDYNSFRINSLITHKNGISKSTLPIGRRYLYSKIRKWVRGDYIPNLSDESFSPNTKWKGVFYDWGKDTWKSPNADVKGLKLLQSGKEIADSPAERGFAILSTDQGITLDAYASTLKDYEYPLINIETDIRELAIRPHKDIPPGGLNGWFELDRYRDTFITLIDSSQDFEKYPSYEAPGILEDVNNVYKEFFTETSIPSYRGWSYKQDALYSLFKPFIYDENKNINIPYLYDWWGVSEKWNSYRADFVLAYAVGDNFALPVIGDPSLQLTGSLMFGYALYDMLYPLVNDTMLFQLLVDSNDEEHSIFSNINDRYDAIDPSGLYLSLQKLKRIEAFSSLIDHYHRKKPLPSAVSQTLTDLNLHPPFHIDENDPTGYQRLDKTLKSILVDYFDQWYPKIVPGIAIKAIIQEDKCHADIIRFTYQPREFGTKEKATGSKTNTYVLMDETVGHVRVFSLTMVIPPDPILVESSKIRGEKTYILIEDFRSGVWKHTTYTLVDKPKRARISQQTGYVLIAN